MRAYGSYYYFDPVRVGSKHILHMNVKFRENFYYRTSSPEKDEYWTVSVYKVEGERLKEEEEIDLFKVVEQFDPDYIPTELGSVYSWNGRELAALQIRSTKDNSVPAFNAPIDREKSSIEELKFFENWISIDPKNLSKTQFKKSSKAYQLLNQKDTEVIVIKPQNSADQYARSIAVFELFMKKGVNLYQDVTIPVEVSKDGQVHTTQTKEEFDQYYDLEKARKAYHEID